MFQNNLFNPPRRVVARRFPSSPLANRAWCPRHSAAECPLLKFTSVNIDENASRLQSVQYILRFFPEKCIWCERGTQTMCIFDYWDQLGPWDALGCSGDALGRYFRPAGDALESDFQIQIQIQRFRDSDSDSGSHSDSAS